LRYGNRVGSSEKSKKSSRAAVTDEGAWREGDDDLAEGYTGAEPTRPVSEATGKPSRQRIEEYFERKRLAEVLQEDLGEDFFRT
jgi:hypothetical protein